jgi:hypothetical protein
MKTTDLDKLAESSMDMFILLMDLMKYAEGIEHELSRIDKKYYPYSDMIKKMYIDEFTEYFKRNIDPNMINRVNEVRRLIELRNIELGDRDDDVDPEWLKEELDNLKV